MILVAIGANLPGPGGCPPLETCRLAVAALGAVPGLRVVAVSRWFRSDPVPPSGQPPYINGVARLAGDMDPAVLLAALQQIERDFGRVRGADNAARTLDLDIIAMGTLVRSAPDPIVPHPRMPLRVFVLAPLLDVAPDWRHPASGTTARALLEALPPQGVVALAASAATA